MCTVSWAYAEGGYVLFFNRDEMRTRRPGTGPEERVFNGVRFLAPSDGEQGGSWLSVNEYGLTIGMLNHYPRGHETPPGDRPSRGRLILDLADRPGCRELAVAMVGTDLKPYPPFRLIGVDRAGVILLTWDGADLRPAGPGDVRPPLTSSSWRPGAVARYRTERFASMVRPGSDVIQGLEAFHHEHRSDRPAESVLMCRPDACTHSVARVDLDRGTVRMRYEPQPWVAQPIGPTEASLALRSWV